MSDQPGPPPDFHPYPEQMLALRTAFDQTLQQPSAGAVAVRTRSAAVDQLVRQLWSSTQTADPSLRAGVAVLALGGFGRGELFPASDVDLLFLLDPRVSEAAVKQPLRLLNQKLWDAGLRASPMTRSLAECGRFQPENVEFTLSLFDARPLDGDPTVSAQLLEKTVPKLIERDRKRILSRLIEVIRTRHARFGDTLFHLEPNVKECPGGLRDAHSCAWLARLAEAPGPPPTPEFQEAREFLVLVRTFLHFRHKRDDNTLDWHSQDEAALASLGLTRPQPRIQSPGADAAYWMRFYFRHARAIERHTVQAVDAVANTSGTLARLSALAGLRRPAPATAGFELRNQRIDLTPITPGEPPPEHDPEIALTLFATLARTGATLTRATERRLEDALPLLSAHLEDGPGLWRHLRAVLTGPFAGQALRAMHALGILELLLPEFHGIDALVIRDAYHRYTVDEHTFVLIDTLHALSTKRTKSAPALEPWAARFTPILEELPHPELLLLAALLHDTGKGHSALAHTAESVRLARGVLGRLELDPYEAGLVLDLIANHLEMSRALRRDIFDAETIRLFAARVPTPEALRMLTLFTYADITAVHPDALTPWKAENLWRLFIATSNFLDRNVDDERIASVAESELGDIVHRIHALVPNRGGELTAFLEGFPRRYLQTRTPDSIRAHFEMAARLTQANLAEANQLDFRYAPAFSELTLVTRDRPSLFASMAGALAAWGMNIVTADAFSNAQGVVVDSFRFTDTFRTLELNEVERTRFVESVHGVMSGETSLEVLLAARQRAPRKHPKVVVETRIDFDAAASTHSTLLQIVAQDTPGLLRALSATLAGHGCNIEVALIDTEGEMAIDVFYLTHRGAKLDSALEATLRETLLEAIETNAR